MSDNESQNRIKLTRTSVSTIKSGSKTISVVQKKQRVYVKKETPQEEANEDAVVAAAVEEKILPVVEELPAIEVITKPEVLDVVDVAPKEVAEKDLTLPTTSVVEADRTAKHVKPQKSIVAEDPKKAAKPKSENKDKEWRRANKGSLVKAAMTAITYESDELDADGNIIGARRRIRPKHKNQKRVELEVTKKHGFEKPVGPIIKEVAIPEAITVYELAQRMSVKAAEVIKILMRLGVMATINQVLDQASASLVVEEMGHTVKLIKDISVEDSINQSNEGDLVARAPVVTVMGHVDHGKTSLLDYIRRTKVAAKEAGGITQHIGAYHVTTERGPITFLDTPGHAAFTAMRARGAKCTDITILVVAADDGVMPQTIEAINHAKAAGVPIIVAVNKIDKTNGDLDKIYNDLSQHGLTPESWGGDTIFIPVSAKVGTGVEQLLESILLQAEMLELKAPRTGFAKGVVLESHLDKGRGPVASVLIQSGTLHQGDVMLAGYEFGRIRLMMDETGSQVKELGPSMPAEVFGLSGAPMAGDEFIVLQDEKKAREVALFRQHKVREVKMARAQAQKFEGFFGRMQQGDLKTLNVVLKADVHGSQEAISEALEALSTESVKVKIIASGVGGINESDVTLAIASEAVLVGFNVRADATARKLAENEGIELNYFSIIYDVVDAVKRSITGLLGPMYKEKIVGVAHVREVFRSSKIGAIAGCMVKEGFVKRGLPIRVLRDNVVIFQGELESLRRFKEDVTEVRSGMECGIGVKSYNDVQVGDHIEAYEKVMVERYEQ